MKAPLRDFTTASELVHYSLYEYIGRRAHEALIVIYANASGPRTYHLVGFSEYTSGSNIEVSADPGGIFRDALLSGAQAIITVHQHPTGNPSPSPADERMWHIIRAVGKVLGIGVIDNLVLGEDSFYSEHNDEIVSYARLRITMPP